MMAQIMKRSWSTPLCLASNAAAAKTRQSRAATHWASSFSTTTRMMTRLTANTGRGDGGGGDGGGGGGGDGQLHQDFTAVATGGYEYAGIPHFANPITKRQWQLEHMAGAFRVFARMGFTEGASGHISVRDTVDPDTFWINPMGIHFGLLTAKDMVHINSHGHIIGGNRAAVNAAGFAIHSAVHAARPDIDAACHMHSKHGKAWSAFGRPLDMLNQDACRFWRNHDVYARHGGVALQQEEGVRIAESLGKRNRAVILQNHGLLTGGGTVDEAAYLFSVMERSCEIQLLVEAAGLDKKCIGEEEAAYTYRYEGNAETLYTEFQPDFQYQVAMSNGQLYGGIDFTKK